MGYFRSFGLTNSKQRTTSQISWLNAFPKLKPFDAGFDGKNEAGVCEQKWAWKSRKKTNGTFWKFGSLRCPFRISESNGFLQVENYQL